MNHSSKLWYVNYITIVFLIVLGIKSLDSSCLTYLSEELIQQLGITTGQYSKLSSYFYLSYSASCVLMGVVLSRVSARKGLIVAMTALVGCVSIAASFVTSYQQLVLCRLGTGLFQGGSMSIIMSIIAKNLVNNDYATRNGLINTGSSCISLFIGPIFFTYMAAHYRWNTAYRFTGAFLLFMAVLILLTVKEVHVEVSARRSGSSALWGTVRECVRSDLFIMLFIIGILESVANLSISVFRPIYYTDIMGYDTVTKAAFLTAGGIAYLPLSFLIPMLSDRFSVKKVMLGTFILALLAPLIVVIFQGTVFSAVVLAVLGGAGGATCALYTYVIPRYAFPERLHGFCNGVILGAACLFGGTVAPAILGDLVDVYHWSLRQVFSVTAAAYAVCILLTLFLRIRKYDPANDPAYHKQQEEEA